ncbi:MAG: hypothetical protein JW869_04540 [Candidatus Omnitrophica bacterium]|nr:hypothetical protein [Candidatus Omnitrophota bacterium]
MKNSIVLFFIILLLASDLALGQVKEGFNYDDQGKRDPFVPLVDAMGRYILEEGEMLSITDLDLSGILWDPNGNSTALINDQIVSTGDSFYGFLIKEINESSVTVSQSGQDYTLWLTIEEGGE